MWQEKFDVDKFNSREQCIKVKNIRAKELREKGHKVVSFILKNQERGYSGFGTVRDTSCRDVFMISIFQKGE